MPPRSTNAPNSAMFLTTPLRIWPGSISASSLLLHLVALVLDQLAAADDDVAAGLVDLEDLALDGLADVVADVGRPADVDLAGGQEDVDADVDQQAALDLAGDHAGDDVAFLVLGDDRLPIPSAAWPCGSCRTMAPVSSSTASSSTWTSSPSLGGTTLSRPSSYHSLQRDDAFALVADVDPDLVADDLADAAGDDLVVLEAPARSGGSQSPPSPKAASSSCWSSSSGRSYWRSRLRFTIADQALLVSSGPAPEHKPGTDLFDMMGAADFVAAGKQNVPAR